jgi:uncharacterized glyoxalase superfamily protein PhnB
MEPRISLVTLGVADIVRARRFYEALGWKASGASNDSVVFFQLGGMALSLYGRTALAEDAHLKPATADGFGGITLAYNGRTKAEVDAVMALAGSVGGTILKPAQDVFWGGYSGYFADPDGHPWEVAWNPGFPIAEDGTIRLPD